MQEFTVSEVARKLNARPSDITLLFYHRALPDDACPIVSGRRRIPESVIPTIAALLIERGKILEPQESAT